jgi:VWFA-related protein
MHVLFLRKPHSFLSSSLNCCIFFISVLLLLSACGSSRTREFALNIESASDSSAKKPLYITGKKPIGQVTNPDGLLLDVWKVESEDYPKEVRVFARVLDSSGNFISGMADPYYKGEGSYKRYWTGITQFLGGDTVEVKEYVVREYGDLDSLTYALALTLDHGGSMAGAIEYLLDAARMFVKMKYPNDRIAIAKFDKKITVERKLTADLRELDSALQNRDLKGYGLYTALYDAMKESITLLKSTNKDTPRALVLFTDGEDNASKTTDAELYAYARANNVRIFPVGFGYVNDSTLKALAQYTGGKYYHVRSKSEFGAVFKDIYESLRNFYKITYSPAPPYTGKTEIEITVHTRGTDGSERGAEESVSGNRRNIVNGEGAKKNVKNPSEKKAKGTIDKSLFTMLDSVNTVFSTTKIYFDYKKAEVRPESAPMLDAIAGALLNAPRIKIEVRGHTDNIGGEEFNQRLSELRASAVVQALVERGVKAERLRSKGLGLSQPVANNDTEDDRQKNRRTEFAIIAR